MSRVPGLIALTLCCTSLALAQDADTDEMRRNLALFERLPAGRQQQVRELDRMLHALPEPNRDPLLAVLDRYAVWLSRLDDADRQRVLSATGAGRVEAIRAIREEQWLRSLSRAARERVAAAGPDGRAAVVAELQKAEHAFEDDWSLAARNWEDLRLNRLPLPFLNEDFRKELSAYTARLRGALTPDEAARLDRAEEALAAGDFLPAGRALTDLSDRHPLVPVPPDGPKTFDDLPPEVRQFLLERKLSHAKDATFPGHGRWPAYALAVADLAARRGLRLPRELGPAKVAQFPPAMRPPLERAAKFVRTKADADRLTQAEGKWPEYPRALLALARAANQPVPGWTLPGPPDKWDRFRPAKRKLQKGG